MPDSITMVELTGMRVLDGATTSVGACVDAAGAVFEAYRVMRGNDTQILVRKVGRDGVELDRRYFDPPFKGDDITLFLTGPHIDVYVVGHAIVGTRYYAPAKGRWENCASPYMAGQPQVGAGGAYIPGGGPQPVPAELTDADIARIVAALQPSVASIIGNIEPKCKAAIEEEGVLRESTVHASPGLYARISESVWEQLTKFFPKIPNLTFHNKE